MDFTKSLMAIFAHPDDESFGMSGTLALAAEHGSDVTVLTLTRGERGSSHLTRPITDEELGAIREAELREAAGILGVRRVMVWQYPDCGLAETSRDELVRRVADVIRGARPHTVVTFEPKGISGHTDHVAVSRIVAEAFQKTKHEPGGPAELYFRAFPRSAMAHIRPVFAERRRAGLYEYPADELLGLPDEQLEAIDVSSVREKRHAALRAHKSQSIPDFEAIGRKAGLAKFADTEYFLRYGT